MGERSRQYLIYIVSRPWNQNFLDNDRLYIELCHNYFVSDSVRVTLIRSILPKSGNLGLFAKSDGCAEQIKKSNITKSFSYNVCFN